MDCEKIIELLNIPPEDRTPDEETLIEEHLGDCAACRAEKELLGRMDGLVKASLQVEADRAEIQPAEAPVFHIAAAHAAPGNRLTVFALAAAIVLAIGTAALGFMLGSARTRVEMLEDRIQDLDQRSVQLEQQMQKKAEQVQVLQEQKTAVPRTVNYYMFPRKTGGQQVSLPGFTYPGTLKRGGEDVKEYF